MSWLSKLGLLWNILSELVFVCISLLMYTNSVLFVCMYASKMYASLIFSVYKYLSCVYVYVCVCVYVYVCIPCVGMLYVHTVYAVCVWILYDFFRLSYIIGFGVGAGANILTRYAVCLLLGSLYIFSYDVCYINIEDFMSRASTRVDSSESISCWYLLGQFVLLFQ